MTVEPRHMGIKKMPETKSPGHGPLVKYFATRKNRMMHGFETFIGELRQSSARTNLITRKRKMALPSFCGPNSSRTSNSCRILFRVHEMQVPEVRYQALFPHQPT
jgi:hypothetical protein